VIAVTFQLEAAMVSCLLEGTMEKLPEVEAAKALMNEAIAWSVMKWLREKKRVRKTADQANDALDQLSQTVKESWPDDIRSAYESLAEGTPSKTPSNNRKKSASPTGNSEALLLARKIKDADDEAYRARMSAEETFDVAEKQLSTALAREGCRKAIQAWDLHEKAIRQAETILHSQKRNSE
jgi:hypothetical protein